VTGQTPGEVIAETSVHAAMASLKAAAASLMVLQQLIDSGQLHAEEAELSYIRGVREALHRGQL
jgi:hypothetical protein